MANLVWTGSIIHSTVVNNWLVQRTLIPLQQLVVVITLYLVMEPLMIAINPFSNR